MRSLNRKCILTEFHIAHKTIIVLEKWSFIVKKTIYVHIFIYVKMILEFIFCLKVFVELFYF